METNIDFKMVPLKDIVADPNQPRKFYDETAMSELVDSVREKGVLQPILLRPKGKGYLLVCGERRYRAACSVNTAIKERAFIPAVIREMNDDEALELQIIENLQRKDVHPLEEAVAFKSLADAGKDIKEIAARVGKSEFFARQRIKLCNLSEKWQKAFFANRVSISDALKLVLFDVEIQDEIFDEQSETGEIKLREWDLRDYSGDLTDAPFDLNDASLSQTMGACTNCKYNSGAAVLFPDAKATCSNLNCFKGKCGANFTKELAKAMQEPDMVFVTDEYSNHNSSDKYIKGVEQSGFSVMNRYQYNYHNIPEKTNYADFKESWLEDNNDLQGCEEAYNKECQGIEKELEEFNKKVSGGKYKKAFMMTGSGKGKYIYITIEKKVAVSKTGSSTKTKEKEAAGTLTADDITEEIQRINDREKRAKQIDENKIWSELRTHFNPSKSIPAKTDGFSAVEKGAIIQALYNNMGYTSRDAFTKHFKIDRRKETTVDVTDEMFRWMIRFFMLEVLPPQLITDGYTSEAKTCLALAGEYFPAVLKDIQNKQADIAAKRMEKVSKRIVELQEKKKELTKPVAKKEAKAEPAKKATTKKAVKKKTVK